MIVDCHTHLSTAAGDVCLSDHLAVSEAVDGCIVLACAAGAREDPNSVVADYIDKHADKMIGFAVVDPTQNRVTEKELVRLTEKLGFKGLVLYCAAAGFHPAHTMAMQLYQLADQMRLPVFFHNGSYALEPQAVLEYAQPYLLDEIARTLPNLKIVIANMGVPFVEQTLSMVAKHPNVYADLTIRPSNVWQTYGIVASSHERGVMGKLLFGSGFPAANPSDCIETLLGINMLMADANLPTVPRSSIRSVIERDALELLAIEHRQVKVQPAQTHLAEIGKPEE